jgi:para-aminobenzoate synthetase/4-amino-4-deoxychorismate lyase
LASAAAAGPFLLFDDARPGAGPGRLYARPVEIVETRRPDEIRACLQRLREAEARGLHAAGFLSYEAGYALEERLAPLRSELPAGATPLLWFGLFEDYEALGVQSALPDAAGPWAGPARPLVGEAEYRAAAERVKAHIAAGDIYQANLSFPAEAATVGDPLALYAAIRSRASAGHGGVVFTGEHWLLSFSPELFFTLEGGQVVTRPMKGTAARGADAQADAAAARGLALDPKQRAENLMIVDLLRNDLSRVARTGTVKVPALFAVETYPTVHQLTSTVTAQLADGIDPVDLIEATFPCGSITGAPKIRAMEIIAALEGAPRGVYTGSIGWISPGGEAAFNVAIRTLVLRHGHGGARIGLGSGIVADSEVGGEWRECLVKGEFVHDQSRSFDLIETMRFDPHEGFWELERHLDRMKRSADTFGFAFDRHDARNELQAATFRLKAPRLIRLRLSPTGAIAIEGRPMPPLPQGALAVAVLPLPVDRSDFRLRHKTSDRGFYDAARRSAGTYEVLFRDDQGRLTEGSFTNLFVERDGRLLTPPLERGLLPGVLRETLIEEGRAIEADLRTEDLARGFLIGNAVRGLIPARLEG